MNENDFLTESYVGRSISPNVEHLVEKILQSGLRELLETRSLYQNLTLESQIFNDFSSDQHETSDLIAEFKKRPFRPCSRSNVVERRFGHLKPFSIGNQPVETPHDELDLLFYLPAIDSECQCCKCRTTFQSMSCSDHFSNSSHIGSPYPMIGENTEQIYVLCYRCSRCRDNFVVFQVLRRGLKLQLTGRSIPFRPEIAALWPKRIRDIIQDAVCASAESDLPAAYYHLRTAIEFYIKDQLGKDPNEKIEGQQLCEEYNLTLNDSLKQGFPSLGPLYSTLSVGLHSRKVSQDEFDSTFDKFHGHLDAKRLFDQYANKEDE